MFKKYFLFFTISLGIYLVHTLYTGQGLYGDGNGYYSYTNTIYFQKNLNFKAIYNHLDNFQGKKYIFSRIFWNQNTNPYLIGTGLVWLPSMAFISTVNKIFNLGASRFALIYELGPGITGILLMLGGLVLLEKYLSNYFSKKPVFWTILTIFFATNVFYYTAFEPALSHQPSFFIICFLLWWSRKFTGTKLNLFILGLLSGLLATIRIADTILLIPIILAVRPKLKDLPVISVGGLIAFLPQLINQQLLYGSFFIHPYLTGGSGTWQFNLVHIFEYLFSTKRGLFLWTPLFLVSIWGLIKSKSWVFLFSILVLWLVTSSWSAYLSAGFGQRFSFSAIPLFAYGLAYVLQKIKTGGTIAIFLIFLIWNSLLIKNVYLHKNVFIQAEVFPFNQFINLMVHLN